VDGVAPSRMVGISASVNLHLHHEVQKFSSGTGSPGWSRKKGRKMVVVHIFWFCCFTVLTSLLQSQIYSRFLISAFLGNKKVPVRMSHTSNTAACLKLSFTAGAA